MYLSDITLKQFRSYDDGHFSFDEKLTLITGKNGTGKTNLLEAIYVLLQGGSFRVADKDLIRHGEQWWRIDGVLGSDPRQVRYQLGHRPPKQLVIHDTTKRFMFRDRLPVVLFEPTDLQLIHGSPARRRDLLDTMLGSLLASYKTTLGKYERALQQRNNILKKHPVNLEDALFSWNVLLSEYGVELIRARYGLAQQLNQLLGGYYTQIVGTVTQLSVIYQSPATDTITTSQYMAALHSKLALDALRGTTSFGPHRDDLEFRLRQVGAKYDASRGEVRTTILALKMSYAKLLEASYGTKPILLFDDVFSELDDDRRENLFSHLGEYQTIITDTHVISRAEKIISI